MEIILKKNILKMVNRYSIKDTKGNTILRTEKKLLSLHNTHTLMDITENHICKIKRKIMSFFPYYRIFFENGRIITVKKNTGSINKKFIVTDGEVDYVIEGNVIENTFTIKKDEEILARVERSIINMFKAYDIKMDDTKYIPLVVSIIITLDIIKYKKLAYLI